MFSFLSSTMLETNIRKTSNLVFFGDVLKFNNMARPDDRHLDPGLFT